jgi:hypothetical protein
MKRICLLMLGLVLALPGAASAQQNPAPAVVVFAQEKAPAPAPVMVAPGTECKTTVCVMEAKKNTKVVYTSRCKEYCLCQPRHSFFGLFGGGDCCNDCGGNNCEKRTRNVLVKRVVPDCDTTQCVLKEVPATIVPCPPAPCGTAYYPQGR